MATPPDLPAVLNAIDAREKAVGFEGLNRVEKALSLTSVFTFEVNLGGFGTYYYNSAGDRAAETVLALRALGAHQTAALLEEANALFPSGSPAPDREARGAQLKDLRRASEDPFGHLDSQADASPGDNLDALMEAFAERHVDELL
jgi:hypothetical protein